MLNYLKIIHFHRKKVYLQVYGLQVIVIYPTSTCRNKFRWNIYYWELNLKIFFPKPSIFTTLCQITSCNLQQCCDIFLVDGMQRSRGPHPLEISLMFPTGSFSVFGHLDVFQVFHCGQDLGQPSAIFASWQWERWTRSFCSAMFPAAGTTLRARSCMSLQDRYVVPSNAFCKSALSRFTVLKCWVPEGQHPKNTLVQWRRTMVTLGDIGERVGEPVVQHLLSITCHRRISPASGVYQGLTNSPVRGFTQLIYLPGQGESCLGLSLSKVAWEEAH